MSIKSALYGLIFTAALSFSLDAEACTNILITRGASKDGSNIISYAADSHVNYGELYFHPAADWAPGTMLRVTNWDTGQYMGDIPQVAHTYKTVGNMNEHQLIIAETTFGGRSELEDRKGILDYGSLIYITLQRASNAREAIKTIVELANTYGYASEGESFSIADRDEVWVMDLIGKGMNIRNGKNMDKGIVWVARRVPDGYICAHANQARITTFPLDDPDNCMYAEDVISFARRKGYFSGADEEFSFSAAYAPYDFGTVRACDARVWAAYNLLSKGWFTYKDENGKLVTKDAYNWLDYAMGYDLENRMPLFIRPVDKISVKDVANAMRDHYEGTPMDMTTDIGAGGNALPYRARPLDWSVNDTTYVNERAIATQQTGFWFVAQARCFLPDVIGGLLWFSVDDAATSYVTPIYSNVDAVPDCLREGNGNIITYSATSQFWINNRVANSCYKMYNHMAPYVRDRIDRFEDAQMEKLVPEMDRKALEEYNKIAYKLQDRLKKNANARVSSDPLVGVRKMLTEYSVKTAQDQFAAWVQLEQDLQVKFLDFNVKPQNPDGTFRHSEHSKKFPSRVLHPGYTDKWKDAVIKDNGETLRVR
ncbi:MAG: C69 family dipeptidase [Bacteroidales bacterium]|nr:C69 family dipeptidase [Bacteroidales bacterium]